MKSLSSSNQTSRPACPWSLAFAATLVCLPLSGIARAQTVSIQTADVQSYFAANSESLPTSQQSDPVGLAPWAPPSGFGPYTITGPAGVPPLPSVPPVPAALGPANSFAVAPWTSLFADLPTNTLSKSVIWANAPPGTNVADGHVGVNMRLENPTTTYAFHQMNFSVDYVANAPLGPGIAGLPTFFVSGTTTGVNSYAEFGASIDYYWTDINTAGIVGTTTPLGSVSYYWSLIGPGSAFLTPVLPTGALAAPPIGATGGLLSVVGKAFVAGDPAVIEVSPVPEPATCFMALAGMACGGVSLWRRRRRA